MKPIPAHKLPLKLTIKPAASKIFEASEGFYHPECHLLYADHDEITNLAECPFPLETPSFKVLLFGREKLKPAAWAVVEYTKTCGHKVQEKVRFEEGVADFDHYGTKYIGADYSVKNWERRIEFFRTCLPCDVCHTLERALWLWKAGSADARSKAKHEASTLRQLDYNYANWRELVNWEKFQADLAGTKKGSH